MVAVGRCVGGRMLVSTGTCRLRLLLRLLGLVRGRAPMRRCDGVGEEEEEEDEGVVAVALLE